MNLLTKLRYVPKRFGVLGALFVAATVPAVLLAWGPDRPTYTTAHPADHVTFNSITDNPAIGDERNFMQVKPAGSANSAYADSITIEPGKEYDVFVYYHNNAASDLNASGKGIAQGAFIRTEIPAVVGADTKSVSYVGATNASPKEVWDDVSYKSTNGQMALSLVAGSAKIYSKGAVNGKALPDSIATSGTALGYDALDGKLPGCNDFAGYVTYRVRANQPNFDVQKTVRVNGATDTTFKENVSVKPGDKVDYQIYYKNTGTTQQKNVIVQDKLPAGMTYVAGSTMLHNSSGTRTVADGVTTSGIDIGGYLPNGDAYIKFTAQVAANDKLPTCGNNTLKNIAQVDTENGSKSDEADVTVPKECQPPQEEAKFACTDLKVSPISGTQFGFEATRSVENAEYIRTVFVVRDEQGKEIARANSTDGKYNYTQATAGKYTVEAQIVVKIDGAEKTSPVGNCKKPFEVKKEEVKPEYACTTLKKITKDSKDTFDFETTATVKGAVTIKEVKVDFGDNTSQVVDYGKTVSHTYKPGKYTAVAYVTFAVDGKNTTPQTSDGCKTEINVEQPPKVDECKPGIPVGDAKCEEKPEDCVPSDNKNCEETPNELPSTGPEAIIGGLFGSSAISYGIYSYVASRRALRDSMNR